jgi:hypothetical protein
MNTKKKHIKTDSLKTATDKTLSIKDGVTGVHGGLVLGGITNQALLICEGNI